ALPKRRVEQSLAKQSLAEQFHGDRRAETEPPRAHEDLAPQEEPEEMESQLPEVFQLQTREDVMWELQRFGPEPAQDRVLESLEATNAALRQATRLDQARRLSDIAEMLAACAQKLDMAEAVQNEAVAFSIRAEYRYNEIVQVARERGEIGESTRGQLRG